MFWSDLPWNFTLRLIVGKMCKNFDEKQQHVFNVIVYEYIILN